MSSEAMARAGEDVENVRSFFDQWGIYRRVIERNHLFHREAYAEVDRVLGGFGGRTVSVLDLGSGDASYMAEVLGRHAVASYHGVDISPVALALARENVGRLGCAAEFTQADFFALVPTLRDVLTRLPSMTDWQIKDVTPAAWAASSSIPPCLRAA